MKLGLWLNPIVAAKTSKVYLEHPEYVMSSKGKEAFWGPVWETEDSYGMCLVSDYADNFIETMVRLNRELGVTVFQVGRHRAVWLRLAASPARNRSEFAAGTRRLLRLRDGAAHDSHRGGSQPPLPPA